MSVYHCLSVRPEAHYVEFDMSSALTEVQAMAGIVKVCLSLQQLSLSLLSLLSAGEDRD